MTDDLGITWRMPVDGGHYYDMVRARRGGLRHLSAFIGQGDSGRSDVAGTYKARLVDGWSAKHGAPIDAPHAVHEPEAAFKRSQPAGGA